VFLATECAAQTQSAETAANVVPVRLSLPAYPRLAQQADISGDVDLVLAVSTNGQVESVNVLSGHAMLRQAAIESARQSTFECRNCDRASSYSLRYRFQIDRIAPDRACSATSEPDPPVELDLAAHQVTISAWQVWICDPAVEVRKARSAKCLYLWKCVQRPNN